MMALCAAAAASTTESIAEKEQRLREAQVQYELQVVQFKEEKLQQEIQEYRREQGNKRFLSEANAVASDFLPEVTTIESVYKKLKGQQVGVEWAKGHVYYGKIIDAKVQVKYDDGELHWESYKPEYNGTCARSPFCTKHNKHTGRCNQLGASKRDGEETSAVADYKSRTSMRVKQSPVFLGVDDGLFDTVARDWKSS